MINLIQLETLHVNGCIWGASECTLVHTAECVCLRSGGQRLMSWTACAKMKAALRKSLREWLCVRVCMYMCVCAHMCVLVWVWLSQSSSASLQSAKVGQPNLSQGGAEELLLCFLLTVEVITSLVMQMSIPLFKLSAMQGSCQRRHIKKKKKKTPSTLPFFLYFPLLLSSLLSEPDFRHLAAQASDIDVEDDTDSPKDMSVSVSLSLSLFSHTLLLSSSLAHCLSFAHSRTHTCIL